MHAQHLFFHAVIAISYPLTSVSMENHWHSEHIAVFTKEGFSIPANDLMVLYSKIHFRSTGRIAKSKRKLRAGLSNNLGIVFCAQAVIICYGELLFTCVN